MQYEQLIEKAKKNKWPASNYMNIVPVSFGERHRLMLANVKKWIDKRQVAIDPSLHSELLTDLRIAESDGAFAKQKRLFNGYVRRFQVVA